MNARSYATIGLFAAPAVAIAIGVWAEFAELTPPLLLAVATPAMAVSLLSAAYLRRLATRSLTIVLLGAAIGLLTFSMAAGLYIAIHYARTSGFDLDEDSDGGSAAVFFFVHVVVGTVAGVVLGVLGAVVAWVARSIRWATTSSIAPSREA